MIIYDHIPLNFLLCVMFLKFAVEFMTKTSISPKPSYYLTILVLSSPRTAVFVRIEIDYDYQVKSSP